jgi:CelD/BcsL family acetyltransferase involved in cellulose biosynthesis
MAAAGFGYHGADGYYLYNSAFDPTLREASPGVVLMASLIESAIEAARDVFDFLKGDEAYKYRLGAGERLLYTVSG